VVSLVAYFDDSYTEDASFALGGYIASVEAWDLAFSPDWFSVLRAAPHPLSEFKASNCRNQRGEFEGWSRAECDALTKRLIGVIVDRKYHGAMVGIGSAVLVAGSVSREIKEFGYLWCAGNVMVTALRWAAGSSLPIDDVHFVFDRQPNLHGKLHQIFETVVASFGDEWRERVRSPEFGDSKHLAPLQAADLLAYETHKEAKSRSERPPRALSKALDALVSGRMHVGEFISPSLLQRAADGGILSNAVELPALYRSGSTYQFRDGNRDLANWLAKLRATL
jgi:hypothetical protein